MKKIGSLLLALALCFSMGTTAFAAKSVSTKVSATLSNGTGVSLSGVTAERSAAAGQVLSNAFGNDEAKNYSVLDAVDIDSTLSYPAKITFKVTGVKKGDTVYVMAYTGSTWKKLSATADKDGEITVTLSEKFESVALVKKTGNTTTSTTTTTTTASPKTGEVGMNAVFALIAACGVALMALNRRKAY